MTTPTQHAELNAIVAEKVMLRKKAPSMQPRDNDLYFLIERDGHCYVSTPYQSPRMVRDGFWSHHWNKFDPTANDADAFAVWRACLKKANGSLETTIVTDGSVRISEDGINPVWGETLNLAIVKFAIALHKPSGDNPR